MLIPNDNFIVAKENKMPFTQNQQHQLNGSGTAILVDKGYNYQTANAKLNNSKVVSTIIKGSNKKT